MGGVSSAREQDSSSGGSARYVCLGVVHMEEEVQDRVQVEVEREEQGKERHTVKNKAKNRESKKHTLNRTSWMTMEMT